MMITNLKPYPRYKDSGVPWLGQVPEHWEVLPNRAVFSEVKERDHPDAEMLSVTITKGVIRQHTLLEDSSKKDGSNQDKSAYKLVRPGDIAYNKMRAWQGAVGMSEYEGIVSPAYVVQRPRKGIAPHYLHHLLRTPAFAKEAERWSYGITSDMWSLRPEHFKIIYSCVPPFLEQAAIVRFLDHADQRIRRYIRAKQKLIKLLEELKAAIIHRAVTGQIDVRSGQPYPRYKDSGVPWLGEVPEHWDIEPLGRSIRVKSGDMILTDAERESGVPIYGGNGIRGYTCTPNAHGPIVLLGRVGAKCGCVHLVNGPLWASEHALRVIPQTEVDLKFLALILEHADLNRLATRTAQPLINSTIVRSHRVAIPPLPEQTSIARFLDQATSEIVQEIERTNREISLLREYRTRLIADVVTGKLDVREAAAKLPDEPPEEEEETVEDEGTNEEGEALADAEEGAVTEEEEEP